MSSLWTPDGEHRVEREPGGPPPEPATSPASAAPPSASGAGAPGDPGAPADPNEAEMLAMARELLAAPVEDIIANHCYGLFELAAIHLSQRPPNLETARTAVDAMGLLVEGLNVRLGAHASTLAEGLNQLRLSWVRIADAAKAAGEAPVDGESPA